MASLKNKKHTHTHIREGLAGGRGALLAAARPFGAPDKMAMEPLAGQARFALCSRAFCGALSAASWLAGCAWKQLREVDRPQMRHGVQTGAAAECIQLHGGFL